MRSRVWLAFVLVLAGCSSQPVEEKKAAEPKAPPAPPPAEYRVQFETTKGKFVIAAHQEWSPHGSDHFYELVQSKFYDGVRFHRVVRGFICQFGINSDPSIQQIWSMAHIPDDPVKHKNVKGTVTYAKLGPNTRATQVFINLWDNTSLDKDGFAPFAEVVEGMDVVESLYYSYGEVAPRGSGPDPTQIEIRGLAYIESKFPRLDSITHATIVKE